MKISIAQDYLFISNLLNLTYPPTNFITPSAYLLYLPLILPTSSNLSSCTLAYSSMAGFFSSGANFTFLIFLFVIFEGTNIEEKNNVPQSLSGRSVELNTAQNLSNYPGRAASSSKLASMATAVRRKTTMASCSDQCIRLINLTHRLLLINALLLLCNDISLNPGPSQRGTVCTSCVKSIRRNQTNTQCMVCKQPFHLKCLSADFEQSKACHLCYTPPVKELDEGESVSLP